MLRDEVFNQLDCVYYTHLILRQILLKIKANIKKHVFENKLVISKQVDVLQASRVVIKNILDLLRMIAFDNIEEIVEEANEELNADDVDSSSFLLVNTKCEVDESDEDSDFLSESESESESENDEVYTKKRKVISNGKADSVDTAKKARSNKRLNRSEQLLDLNFQKKAFSNVWLTVLSVTSRMESTQSGNGDKYSRNISKLILKHISEYVIPHLTKPLLLADYLSVSYKQGCTGSKSISVSNSEHSTTVAILALESLFKLIVEYNLDYPSFFVSLYQLTSSLQVFNSKYKHKFLKLLSMSLKSTNLPAYLAAAFIKKLLFVSCQGSSSTCGRFCLTQAAALLRAHPQCMTLLHAKTEQKAGAFKYDELTNLENCNSLHTSLFEIEALKLHFYAPIAELAETMQSKHEVTKAHTTLAMSEEWKVEPYVNDTYSQLIDSMLQDSMEATSKEKSKKRKHNGKFEEDEVNLVNQGAALNHLVSDVLFVPDSMGGSCFGK